MQVLLLRFSTESGLKYCAFMGSTGRRADGHALAKNTLRWFSSLWTENGSSVATRMLKLFILPFTSRGALSRDSQVLSAIGMRVPSLDPRSAEGTKPQLSRPSCLTNPYQPTRLRPVSLPK